MEGDDIFTTDIDVIACDGFVGNVSLKTSEGVAKMITHFIKEEFTRSWYNKIAAMIAMPVLKAFRNRIDPRTYNGASMLGLNGIVIKSHGGTDEVGFANAINIAIIEAEHDIPNKISKHLEVLLEGQA